MKEKVLPFIVKNKYKLLLTIVIIAYTIISFYKLGSTKWPQTLQALDNDEYVVFKINNEETIGKLKIFTGPSEMYLTVNVTDDYENKDSWVRLSEITADYSNILKWNTYEFYDNRVRAKYLVLSSYWFTTNVGDIKVFTPGGNEIQLEAIDERGERLLDESKYCPHEYEYMTSAYFDEVYFPRTVYEIMNNRSIYEYTHPPLGKLIMSIPVYFLGLSPFSYRFMGNVSGILMILVIYEIAVAMFKKEKYGLFAAIIMALDGMHFGQTRIGTCDGYLVLFCLCSFLFFLKYLHMDKEKNFKAKIISLLIAGTFWGLAISVKWTAFFFGAGLGVLWLFEFLFKADWKRKGKFSPAIVLYSILGFVIIPATIYVLSYIPIINNPNSTLTYYTSQKEVKAGEVSKEYTVKIHDVESFFTYQRAMYIYHSELQMRKEATGDEIHPFSSKWYTWPYIGRPLWFYVGRFYDDADHLVKYGTIACMGNPAIWWLGMGTTIITLIYSLIKRNKEGMILMVMIAATWLTYAFIDREMFIYHYFITLPFVMLTIVFALSRLIEWKNHFKILLPILCTIFLGFFIYFYPVFSGIPVDKDYIKQTQWFEKWDY